MSEINFITPYDCFRARYCTYTRGFDDGFVMALSLILITIIFYIGVDGIINNCSCDCKKYDIEETSEGKDNESEEEEDNSEKTEESKKDD